LKILKLLEQIKHLV